MAGNETLPVDRVEIGPSVTDVLDRVLDKGIVIDAYVRVSVIGIDLVTFDVHIVVAAIETYLAYAPVLKPSLV